MSHAVFESRSLHKVITNSMIPCSRLDNEAWRKSDPQLSCFEKYWEFVQDSFSAPPYSPHRALNMRRHPPLQYSLLLIFTYHPITLFLSWEILHSSQFLSWTLHCTSTPLQSYFWWFLSIQVFFSWPLTLYNSVHREYVYIPRFSVDALQLDPCKSRPNGVVATKLHASIDRMHSVNRSFSTCS